MQNSVTKAYNKFRFSISSFILYAKYSFHKYTFIIFTFTRIHKFIISNCLIYLSFISNFITVKTATISDRYQNTLKYMTLNTLLNSLWLNLKIVYKGHTFTMRFRSLRCTFGTFTVSERLWLIYLPCDGLIFKPIERHTADN